ncbi:MAG: hypothetical protein DRR19_28745 [Candidatus Parabeggiatoa sp. nov. 1]|nr:MAG: hypothetical protein DRR19_28745 [Gammaproteobacteria bacterium]
MIQSTVSVRTKLKQTAMVFKIMAVFFAFKMYSSRLKPIICQAVKNNCSIIDDLRLIPEFWPLYTRHSGFIAGSR